jgi:hypothetical protein
MRVLSTLTESSICPEPSPYLQFALCIPKDLTLCKRVNVFLFYTSVQVHNYVNGSDENFCRNEHNHYSAISIVSGTPLMNQAEGIS